MKRGKKWGENPRKGLEAKDLQEMFVRKGFYRRIIQAASWVCRHFDMRQ